MTRASPWRHFSTEVSIGTVRPGSASAANGWLPAWLSGSCLARRFGEMLHEPRFVPRNAVYIADAAGLPAKGVAWVVSIRPYTLQWDSNVENVGTDVADCESTLRKTLGAPEYEDSALIAFRLCPPSAESATPVNQGRLPRHRRDAGVSRWTHARSNMARPAHRSSSTM